MMLFIHKLHQLMTLINRCLVFVGAVALTASAVILSYSVISRAVFKAVNDWQDEASLFCLLAATFLCTAYVQEIRGHIGISAVASMLPKKINRVRAVVIDIASCLFCAFFAWKSWDLTSEAWVDGQITNSTWGPPLWIPYSIMSIGMTLLAVQIFLQVFLPTAELERGH